MDNISENIEKETLVQMFERTPLNEIFSNKFGRDLTDEEKVILSTIDITAWPIELNISASEKRQVRQYESNDYYASIKIDLSGVQTALLTILKNASSVEEFAENYQNMKQMVYEYIREKYTANERFLRKLLQEAQLKDGINR